MAEFIAGSQAVFSRNWRKYLRAAATASKFQGKRITFQSRVRWIGAREAIKTSGPIRIYFAVNADEQRDGQEALVEYEADLVEVIVDPSKRAPATKRLLGELLNETADEGLWGETLYSIANCRKVKSPFPISALHKTRQRDEPLDANYSRSYALVRQRAN